MQIFIAPQTLSDISQRERFRDGMSCFSNILRPQSRGMLRLSSADPEESPVIDPKYLEKEVDVDTLLSGDIKAKNWRQA